MAALPYIQFYPADYLADTSHLTLEEHGAYLLLILNYWQTGRPLRADAQRMSSVCSTSVENWNKIKPILAEFFDTSDGSTWRHERIENDLEKVRAKSQKARFAGQKSAAQRIEKKKESNERSNDRTNKRTNHTDTDTDTDTDKTITPPPPLNLSAGAWDDYVRYRRQNKMRKLKPASITRLQVWLSEQGDDKQQQAIIDQSIRNGWTGLFELKDGNGQPAKQQEWDGYSPPDDTYADLPTGIKS